MSLSIQPADLDILIPPVVFGVNDDNLDFDGDFQRPNVVIDNDNQIRNLT